MKSALFLVFSLASFVINAQNIPIRLPNIISDHAVLQQSSEVSVWGWGPSTLDMSIVCSWSPLDTIKVLINDDCTWKAKLNTPKAGTGYNLQFFVGNDKIIVSDVSIGEVWLSSGQSNMEMKTSENILDAGDALKVPKIDGIRFFQINKSYDIYPHSDLKGEWIVCDSTTVKNFSAVAFFFGLQINKMLQVPIGLINASWGGTSIQPWMPKTAFSNEVELNTESHFGTAWAPQGTSILYNTMIFPLSQYKLAGVLWYQGESNALNMREAINYGKLFKSMIRSWRKDFADDFPFYYVQIAPFDGYYPKDAAAYLREQQELALQMPKTGMVTIGDLVDNVKDIHPRIKASTGNRLANLALKEQYGFYKLQPYSPQYDTLRLDKQKVIISVKSVGKLTGNSKTINGFRIAGNDKIFYSAKAIIAKKGDIILQSNQVNNPVAVRYCFTNEEIPNLFDTNGLPLMPFRTDKW